MWWSSGKQFFSVLLPLFSPCVFESLSATETKQAHTEWKGGLFSQPHRWLKHCSPRVQAKALTSNNVCHQWYGEAEPPPSVKHLSEPWITRSHEFTVLHVSCKDRICVFLLVRPFLFWVLENKRNSWKRISFMELAAVSSCRCFTPDPGFFPLVKPPADFSHLCKLIAEKLKPHSEGDFVKTCLVPNYQLSLIKGEGDYCRRCQRRAKSLTW